jgi:glutamine amidotransferase
MIAVIDYGRGNLFSIGQALRHLDAEFEVSSAPDVVAAADRIIFPGVGAFADAMAGLQERGLVEPLKAAARAGTPILGICVGCQLMLSRSEEFGDHTGLDLIPGTVKRLPPPDGNDAMTIRIPNVGWRRLSTRPDAPVLGETGADDMMYFVHSYAPMVSDPATIAATTMINGASIPVAIAQGALVGVQFHPEKSGPAGLRLLERFVARQFHG